ncbi:YbaN family protein [Haemophilus parahaemolyticus]
MKILYALLGFIFLGIGIAGIILPGLPGTIFLLSALFCFTRSSERLHNWFIHTKIYQKHLKEFNEQRALTKKAKVRILMIGTIAMGITFFLTSSWVIKSVILCALIVKYAVFFFYIKTLDQEIEYS